MRASENSLTLVCRQFLTMLLLALVTAGAASAQPQLDVTFRFFPSAVGGERAFIPGTFNNWGQPYKDGTNNCIEIGRLPEMEFVSGPNYLRQTMALTVGSTYDYKYQIHNNVAGTDCSWITDPLNPRINTNDHNNSILTVTDPLVFQVAEERDPGGSVVAYSAGLFSSQPISSIRAWVNGAEVQNEMAHYDTVTGIFRYEIPNTIRQGSQFIIEMTDSAGRMLVEEIGRIHPPIDWLTQTFSTVGDTYELEAVLTKLDGSIDPALTEATLVRNALDARTVAVDNGSMVVDTGVELGTNIFQLRATIDGREFLSDPVTITRRLHPLDREFVTASVPGGVGRFDIFLSVTDQAPDGVTIEWTFDELLSTATVTGLSMADRHASGEVTRAGELYFTVTATRPDGESDFMRIALIADASLNVREMGYKENPEWSKRAVVYEIFPLSFGPRASGNSINPGNRINEITQELDYIAAMGFTAIWFMPIMKNQSMTPISGGYNIVDFTTVDPILGTNDDFRALVDRAHELGIRVVMDITPNHVSPAHPWVTSLREGGPYADFIQTEANNHTSGLDGRGANLQEVWQDAGNGTQYRKYDGFGDLANVDWANDDLQATMLETFKFWIEEFGIDGWRFDVYWGPWRKWGPDRFGRPIRDLMKRIRPDAWLLGEIAGTGSGTDVYYADDIFGSRVAGGLDAAYDWNFFWQGVRGTYGATNYHDTAFNGGFWPGPNARYFRFLENHDEERLAKAQSSTNRIKAMTGFLMTTTGVPMIYQGQEVNYGAGSGDTRRTSVDWNTERNGEFAELHQFLAHARGQFKAFGSQEMRRVATTSGIVYGVVRPMMDENALVLINYGAIPQTVTLDPSDDVEISHDGPVPYYDIAADTVASYVGGFSVTIPAYKTVIYITSDDPGFTQPPLPEPPFGAVYTGKEYPSLELPKTIELEQNFPNPFNPSTIIQYSVPESGPVRLVVYDLLGREVSRLVDAFQSVGAHRALFEADNLTSGIYIYRLDAGGRSLSKTMVLLR